MRILLADRDRRVCSALNLLLKCGRDLNVVGESASVDGLVAQIQALQPDLVLLDWELPGKPDAALVESLQELVPSLKIVVLSSHPEAEEEALRAGVDCFVSKVDPPESLLAALDGFVRRHQAGAEGEYAACPQVTCRR